MLRSFKKLLWVAGLCALPFTACTSRAQVGFSITVAPPVIPVYEQPLCPAEGYLWTPGYWGYATDDYYWVPGAWVLPPRVGYLWTPGYWGFGDGLYAFHSGYWGPSVGFYGGVNYGCGYNGYGYGGGYWRGDRFLYNTAVTRVNTTVIRNTYINRTVINEGRTNSRLSFNGRGGINARPDNVQRRAEAGPRLRATDAQVERRREAGRDRSQFAQVNGGRPARLASERAQGRGPNGPGDRQAARPSNGEASDRFSRQGGRTVEGRGNGLQRQTRAERQFNGGNGLTADELQLAQRRESLPDRGFSRERQAGFNPEQRMRRMEERQQRQQQEFAPQQRMEAREMRQRGDGQPREMRREVAMRQPQGQGPMGRGEGQRQIRQEGQRQIRQEGQRQIRQEGQGRGQGREGQGERRRERGEGRQEG